MDEFGGHVKWVIQRHLLDHVITGVEIHVLKRLVVADPEPASEVWGLQINEDDIKHIHQKFRQF